MFSTCCILYKDIFEIKKIIVNDYFYEFDFNFIIIIFIYFANLVHSQMLIFLLVLFYKSVELKYMKTKRLIEEKVLNGFKRLEEMGLAY